MLTVIEDMLPASEVKRYREALALADWRNGASSAGSLSTMVKHNQQVSDHCPVAMELANALLSRFGNHPQFVSAAMPSRIHMPRFNRYRTGETYGVHVDGSVMPMPHSGRVMRTDLAATLFLSDPEEYEGGELVIETAFGSQAVKLNAGGLALYPASSLHQVVPVGRGERLGAICWVQSMIRADAARSLLFDLDESIQLLTLAGQADREMLLRLSGVYHNLVRMLAEV